MVQPLCHVCAMDQLKIQLATQGYSYFYAISNLEPLRTRWSFVVGRTLKTNVVAQVVMAKVVYNSLILT